VKAGAEKKLAGLYHGELWGDRKTKYDALWQEGSKSASINALPNRATQYPFVARDFSLDAVYQQGFGVQELMPVNSRHCHRTRCFDY
jgi:hypothetical protein